MQPAIDYARPTTPRRRPWRKILLVAGILIVVPLVVFGGFIAWFQYEMTRNQLVIMVENKASAPVEATLFETGASSPTVALNAVAAGQKGDRDQNAWRSITPATFRVRVGTHTYEGDAGYLLDDDGPHRFWVKAFDDHVVVTRQSNEAPWDLKMQPAGAASQPAR
jgi:hypothetical protein